MNELTHPPEPQDPERQAAGNRFPVHVPQPEPPAPEPAPRKRTTRRTRKALQRKAEDAAQSTPARTLAIADGSGGQRALALSPPDRRRPPRVAAGRVRGARYRHQQGHLPDRPRRAGRHVARHGLRLAAQPGRAARRHHRPQGSRARHTRRRRPGRGGRGPPSAQRHRQPDLRPAGEPAVQRALAGRRPHRRRTPISAASSQRAVIARIPTGARSSMPCRSTSRSTKSPASRIRAAIIASSSPPGCMSSMPARCRCATSPR